MLSPAIIAQLKTHLAKIGQPIELVATVDQSAKSVELTDLLTEVAGLSELISATFDGEDGRKPSFAIKRVGTDIGVRFAGIPMGHEFTSFVLALLQVGGYPSTASDDVIEQIRALEGQYNFVTYFSLSCQNCPDVVQALNLMSIINPNITHIAVDGALFPEEVAQREILAVPTVFLNGELFDQGRMSLDQILAKLDTGAVAREAARIDAAEPFDMLVIGGGPAGATAAIYSARKGIRTGLVAERFGGQVLDTMAIENFISMPYTEGPRLVTAMEEHVRSYDVDVMNLQLADELIPADAGLPLHQIKLASGATLAAKSLVLAPGARWRNLGVAGEQEYRNKGVTYCPHCDGPLFKGKAVAVIGGGNSGVEAAIDLAGVVEHVTLLEFQEDLLADDVLVRKLRSLPNVEVLLMAQTTEIVGDGARVTGLRYQDRHTGAQHELKLAGVFVQIGLLPNTEWLQGTVHLSERGEIVVDDHGRTSIPGVFAAGDATTTPFKQIVIALGAGATASLSAFDYLMRSSAPAADSDANAAAFVDAN